MFIDWKKEKGGRGVVRWIGDESSISFSNSYISQLPNCANYLSSAPSSNSPEPVTRKSSCFWCFNLRRVSKSSHPSTPRSTSIVIFVPWTSKLESWTHILKRLPGRDFSPLLLRFKAYNRFQRILFIIVHKIKSP